MNVNSTGPHRTAPLLIVGKLSLLNVPHYLSSFTKEMTY